MAAHGLNVLSAQSFGILLISAHLKGSCVSIVASQAVVLLIVHAGVVAVIWSRRFGRLLCQFFTQCSQGPGGQVTVTQGSQGIGSRSFLPAASGSAGVVVDIVDSKSRVGISSRFGFVWNPGLRIAVVGALAADMFVRCAAGFAPPCPWPVSGTSSSYISPPMSTQQSNNNNNNGVAGVLGNHQEQPSEDSIVVGVRVHLEGLVQQEALRSHRASLASAAAAISNSNDLAIAEVARNEFFIGGSSILDSSRIGDILVCVDQLHPPPGFRLVPRYLSSFC